MEQAEVRRISPKVGTFRLDKLTPYVVLAPWLVIVAVVVYYPSIVTLWRSFHAADLGPAANAPFIGLGNYLALLSPGSELWGSALISAEIILICLPLELAFGLLGALILNQSFRGRGLVRTLALVPWILPPIANGFMWNWILNGDLGALNGLLYQFGFIHEYQHWLAAPAGQVAWTAIAEAWTRYAFVMLVLLAGLQAIPLEIYDAAKLDGASAIQSFLRMTFPLLLPSFTIALVVELIFTIQIFDLIWSITGGGAAGAAINPFTKALMVLNYEIVFQNLKLGLGSAMSYLVLLLSLFFGFFFVRLLAVRGGR
jgi:multiple sugar transport system permease protein